MPATRSCFACSHDPWVSSLPHLWVTSPFIAQSWSKLGSPFYCFIGIGLRAHYLQAIFWVSFTVGVSTSLRPVSFFPAQFSKGWATFAFDCHIPSEIIKLHGDWQSDAYLVYLELSQQQKQCACHAMASKVTVYVSGVILINSTNSLA